MDLHSWKSFYICVCGFLLVLVGCAIVWTGLLFVADPVPTWLPSVAGSDQFGDVLVVVGTVYAHVWYYSSVHMNTSHDWIGCPLHFHQIQPGGLPAFVLVSVCLCFLLQQHCAQMMWLTPMRTWPLPVSVSVPGPIPALKPTGVSVLLCQFLLCKPPSLLHCWLSVNTIIQGCRDHWRWSTWPEMQSAALAFFQYGFRSHLDFSVSCTKSVNKCGSECKILLLASAFLHFLCLLT